VLIFIFLEGGRKAHFLRWKSSKSKNSMHKESSSFKSRKFLSFFLGGGIDQLHTTNPHWKVAENWKRIMGSNKRLFFVIPWEKKIKKIGLIGLKPYSIQKLPPDSKTYSAKRHHLLHIIYRHRACRERYTIKMGRTTHLQTKCISGHPFLRNVSRDTGTPVRIPGHKCSHRKY